MIVKFAPCSLVALLLAAAAVQMSAQGPSPRPRDGSTSTTCADLTRLRLDNSTITSATLVTSGTLAPSATVSLTHLPAFCRVQGMSKPSSDSNINFEVWLPQPADWNGKFLSSGEGGFAGTVNYTRNGLDGGDRATGNPRLRNEGRTDQVKARVRQTGERLKDAVRGR